MSLQQCDLNVIVVPARRCWAGSKRVRVLHSIYLNAGNNFYRNLVWMYGSLFACFMWCWQTWWMHATLLNTGIARLVLFRFKSDVVAISAAVASEVAPRKRECTRFVYISYMKQENGWPPFSRLAKKSDYSHIHSSSKRTLVLSKRSWPISSGRHHATPYDICIEP